MLKHFAKMFKKSYTDDLNTTMILEYAIPLLKSATIIFTNNYFNY